MSAADGRGAGALPPGSAPPGDPVPELGHARRLLAAWPAPSAAQAAERDRILAFLAEHPEDGHRRTCLAGHLTASTLLLDAAGERVLLHHHRKLDRWLQFGGHCDGDADLRGVAWRELEEESGITPAWMSPAPVDVDIHTIPARRDEPEHWHLDVRFLSVAPADAVAVRSDESKALRWFSLAEARALDVDDSVLRLLDLAEGLDPGALG